MGQSKAPTNGAGVGEFTPTRVGMVIGCYRCRSLFLSVTSFWWVLICLGRFQYGLLHFLFAQCIGGRFVRGCHW